MSKLTSYNSERIYWAVEQVEREAGDIDDLHLDDNLFYLKSEADKVIAELKAQKAQAEDDCAYWKMCHWNAANAMHETEEYAMQLYNETRHQKYKRCLAMAAVCSSYKFAWSFIPEDDEVHKSDFYKKWHKRWLELAEKFKEADDGDD